jgi:ABC-type transport system involved in multi-copper enzyme maturation permease subunit
MMLRYIIKKEILEIITSPKFIFTFILCAILILLSVYTGVINYRAELKEYATSVSLSEKDISALPNIQALSGHTIRISKPPSVLGTIVNGIEESVGRVAPISRTTDPSLIDSKYDSNPVSAVFGTLDLMFIVKIVLSLFAVLFTYDVIVGEKERGTLKLALANSVPRDQFILGKAIGGYICLLIPLLIPMILGIVAMMIVPNVAFTSDDWLRLLMIFIMFLLYLSVFFGLGLFVSARTSRSSTSFLILLFIWVIFVMVIPKIAVIAAAQIEPIPSIHEITSQKAAFLLQAESELQNSNRKWGQEHTSEYDKDPKVYQEIFMRHLAEVTRDFQLKVDSTNAAIDLKYNMERKSQQSLAENLSRISPASALSFGTMSLARTGVEEYDRFLKSVRAYKGVYMNWLLSKVSQSLNAKPGGTIESSLKDMPQHRMEPEQFGESIIRTIPDYALMIVMILVFFTGAYFSFRRYDVR